MSDEVSSPKPKRRITRRVHHSEEIWAQARRDYLAGFTASAVSKHYGMSVDAIRKRASKQGWCKAHHLSKNAPAPLSPFPDADQASRIGPSVFRSRWLEAAHPAQLAPASTPSGAAWSTRALSGRARRGQDACGRRMVGGAGRSQARALCAGGPARAVTRAK